MWQSACACACAFETSPCAFGLFALVHWYLCACALVLVAMRLYSCLSVPLCLYVLVFVLLCVCILVLLSFVLLLVRFRVCISAACVLACACGCACVCALVFFLRVPPNGDPDQRGPGFLGWAKAPTRLPSQPFGALTCGFSPTQWPSFAKDLLINPPVQVFHARPVPRPEQKHPGSSPDTAISGHTRLPRREVHRGRLDAPPATRSTTFGRGSTRGAQNGTLENGKVD